MIKKTSSSDFESLAILEKECFPTENWNLEQVISHHDDQKSLLYFPENSQNPTGYLLYMENAFEVEILRIGILPGFRRQGIAMLLLDYLEKIANSKEILLEVKSTNLAAIELYKKKGFINFAVRKRYYPDGKDAFLMKKEQK